MMRFLRVCVVGVLGGCAGGCAGGMIQAELTLPKPGGVTLQPDGSMVMSPGVVVATSDGTSVCERIRVRVYTSASTPAALDVAPSAAPVAEGKAIGAYSALQPACVAPAVNLAPRDDYWMIVEYPGGRFDDPYLTYGVPILSAPPAMSAGFYPVKVVDKQTTTVRATLVLPPKPSRASAAASSRTAPNANAVAQPANAVGAGGAMRYRAVGALLSTCLHK